MKIRKSQFKQLVEEVLNETASNNTLKALSTFNDAFHNLRKIASTEENGNHKLMIALGQAEKIIYEIGQHAKFGAKI